MLGIEADTQVFDDDDIWERFGDLFTFFSFLLDFLSSFSFSPFYSPHLEYQISYFDLAIVLIDLVLLSCPDRLPFRLLVWLGEHALSPLYRHDWERSTRNYVGIPVLLAIEKNMCPVK
jgi:hypothetical protein